MAEPADYAPGTTFQYAQNVIALPKIIERTTGRDFQAFAQREVFGIDETNERVSIRR